MLQLLLVYAPLLLSKLLECDAFLQPSHITIPSVKPTQRHDVQRYVTTKLEPRDEFLESLDLSYELNANSPTRTGLLQNLIDYGTNPGGVNLSKPGRAETFESVAPGTWKVVYAPHMTTAAGLLKVCATTAYSFSDTTSNEHPRPHERQRLQNSKGASLLILCSFLDCMINLQGEFKVQYDLKDDGTIVSEWTIIYAMIA